MSTVDHKTDPDNDKQLQQIKQAFIENADRLDPRSVIRKNPIGTMVAVACTGLVAGLRKPGNKVNLVNTAQTVSRSVIPLLSSLVQAFVKARMSGKPKDQPGEGASNSPPAESTTT